MDNSEINGELSLVFPSENTNTEFTSLTLEFKM